MRPKRPTRRLAAALAATLLAAALVPAVASAGMFAPESGGSPNAGSIKVLWWMVFAIALVVFIGVEGALIYSFFKFRARKGSVAAQIHGNTRLEIGWTVGAAAILVFITVFTFIKLPAIKNPPASEIDANGNPVAERALFAATDQKPPPKGASMRIRVDGQQYVWRYQYPGPAKVFSYVDMVVPAGMTVLLDITSDDVAHSWWIPKLGGKMDAIPGYTNRTWFQIPESVIPKGARQVVFTGQCAELCGRNHANMYGRVIGMRFPDYQRWYQGKAQQIKQAEQAAAAQRKALEASQGGQAGQSGGGGTGAGGANSGDTSGG